LAALKRLASSCVLREGSGGLTLQFRRAARGRIGIGTLQLRAAFGGVRGWAIHFERAALGRDGADRFAALVGHGLPRPNGVWRGSVRAPPGSPKMGPAARGGVSRARGHAL